MEWFKFIEGIDFVILVVWQILILDNSIELKLLTWYFYQLEFSQKLEKQLFVFSIFLKTVTFFEKYEPLEKVQ